MAVRVHYQFRYQPFFLDEPRYPLAAVPRIHDYAGSVLLAINDVAVYAYRADRYHFYLHSHPPGILALFYTTGLISGRKYARIPA
jgi:hypothetical protein